MITQIDRHPGRICVTCHVAQRLLGDAEDLIFKNRSKRSISAANVEMYRELFCGELLSETSKSRGQRVLCRNGAKVPDAATSFCETLADVFPSAVYLLAGRGDLRLREQLSGELELHRHSNKTLR